MSAVFFFSNELRLEIVLESCENIDFDPDGKKGFQAQVVCCAFGCNLKRCRRHGRRTESVNIIDKNPQES